jgi:hypothetical protein
MNVLMSGYYGNYAMKQETGVITGGWTLKPTTCMRKAISPHERLRTLTELRYISICTNK